jgi:HPt (histidine-containing phosphotransfer) domain-containing protein
MDWIANVPNDIADLLPAFRASRDRELAQLRDALERNDFARLQEIGERMFAVGNPYGFRQITTFGKQIRDACAAQDVLAISNAVALYRQYLAQVEIRFEEPPAERPVWTPERRAEEAAREQQERPAVRARSERRV